MIEKVKERLLSLGITPLDEDMKLLTLSYEKANTYVENFCHIKEIPTELLPCVVDIAVGEFLRIKKSFGVSLDIDLSPLEKSISEGDTSVTYAIGDGDKTKEERFDEVISLLISSSLECLKFYRKLRW